MKQSEKRIEGIIILIISIVYIWGIWNFNGIVILMDEFSYWEHAASFNNYDWTSVITTSAWYSWGYSVLLAPLFWVCDNMFLMYKLAIILNGMMMLGVYFLAKSIMEKLYPFIAYEVRVGMAMMVSLYSSYIAQSKIAWAETAVYFTVWVLIWCFVNMVEGNSLIWAILTSAMTGVVYIFHNRMIVVIIALIIVSLWMKFEKRITWMNLGGLCIPLCLLYVLNTVIKNILQVNLQLSSGKDFVYNLNNVSDRAWRFQLLLNWDGIWNAIQCALGELVYVNMSTFTLAVIGLVYVSSRLVMDWKNKENTKNYYVYLFLLLIFVGEWIVSTIVNMPLSSDFDKKSVTYVYYGRYLDSIIPFFILFGGCSFFDKCNNKQYKKIVLLYILMFLITVLVSNFADKFSNQELNSVCIPGIWYIDRIPKLSIVEYTFMIEGVMLIIFLLLGRGHYEIKRVKYLSFIMVGIYTTVGILYVIFVMNYFTKYTPNVFKWLYSNMGTNDVYCLEDEDIRYYTQAALYDRKVKVISEDEVVSLPENSFLVTENARFSDELHICLNNDRDYVFLTDGDVYQKFLDENKIDKKNERWAVGDKDVLMEGFHGQEYDWRWMDCARSRVTGCLEKGTYNVVLRLGPAIPFNNLEFDSTKVEIYWNNILVSDFLITRIEEDIEITFTIREEIVESGENVLELTVDHMWSPAEFGLQDERQLGISVKEILFSEQR